MENIKIADRVRVALMVVLLLVGGCMIAEAQQIQVVDTEGIPVGLASVINGENGKVIGTTDLDGVLPDVGGTQRLTVRHVAYKPATVDVKSLGADGRIVLDDADYSLAEFTVKPKDYIYVQTYYRMLMMYGDTIAYYRSGLTDNVYDIAANTVKSDHSHYSLSFMGIFKFMFGLLGGYFDAMSNLPNINTKTDKAESEFTVDSVLDEHGRRFLRYKGTAVGYYVDDTIKGVRRRSIDCTEVRKLMAVDHLSEKLQRRMAEDDAKKKNVEDMRNTLYKLNSDGRCGIADFMSEEYHEDYDEYSEERKADVHWRIWFEVYSTDRAYVDKQELKAKKRENKLKMTYDNLLPFEQQHSIPPLPDNAREAIAKLAEK